MLGERLRFAREAVGMRQTDAAEALNISPSGVSNLEDGTREPRASQLAVLARLYHRTVEFFLEDGPLVSDFVLWRCRPADEEEAQSIQRRFFSLCEDYRGVEELTGEARRESLPSDPTSRGRYGYNQAEALAARTWRDLDLGAVPAQLLRHVLEERFGVRVFALALDPPASSLCTVSDRFGYGILLNQRSVSWRRNYDLAHEFFHLLTWESFGYAGSSREADEEDERWADCFASSLLLPEAPFRARIKEFVDPSGTVKMTFADLNGIAGAFDVSSLAVLFRLAGLLRWRKEKSREIADKLREFYSPRESAPIDALPERYVYLTAQAYRQGLISFGKAAKLLRASRKDAEAVLEPPDDGVDLNATIEVASV